MSRHLYRWDPETRTFYEVFTAPYEPKAPGIITDEIAPTVSHADGRTYTSKSKLKQASEQAGFRVKETGAKYTKKTRFGNEKEIAETAQQARTMVRDGMAPLTEWDKHVCKIENQALSRKK